MSNCICQSSVDTGLVAHRWLVRAHVSVRVIPIATMTPGERPSYHSCIVHLLHWQCTQLIRSKHIPKLISLNGPSPGPPSPNRPLAGGPGTVPVPVTVTLAVTFKLPHHLPGPNGSICRAYLAHHLPGAGPVTTNQDISRSRYRLLDY